MPPAHGLGGDGSKKCSVIRNTVSSLVTTRKGAFSFSFSAALTQLATIGLLIVILAAVAVVGQQQTTTTTRIARIGVAAPGFTPVYRGRFMPGLVALYDIRTRVNTTLPFLANLSTNFAIETAFRETQETRGGILLGGVDLVTGAGSHALMGGVTVDSCAALDLIAKSLNVMFLGTYCFSTDLRDQKLHPNFYSLMPADSKFAQVILSLAVTMKWRRIGILYENNNQGLCLVLVCCDDERFVLHLSFGDSCVRRHVCPVRRFWLTFPPQP